MRLNGEILKAFPLEWEQNTWTWLPRAAVTNSHKAHSSKQKFIVSQLWRLQVWNQGIRLAMFSLKALVADPSWALPSFRWFSTIPRSPWLTNAALKFLSLSSHGVLLCVRLCLSSFYKNTSHTGGRHIPLQHDFILALTKTLFPITLTFTGSGA